MFHRKYYFEICLLCVLWDKILERFDATSKTLQKIEIELATCVHLYESLLEFVRSLRNDETFENFEEMAKLLVEDYNYRAEHQRSRIRKRYFEETTTEIVMSPRQNFKTTTFYSILDSLTTELMKRKEVYCKLQNKFGFLFQITNLSHLELREAASNLQKHFCEDLEYAFVEELIQFSGYMKQFLPERYSPLATLGHIRSAGISEIFPNVDIVYRLYLTLPAANTTGERSFSVLKRVKNELRSTLCEDKLCNLSLLCIESDLTKDIDFQDVIDDCKNEIKKKVNLMDM